MHINSISPIQITASSIPHPQLPILNSPLSILNSQFPILNS